MLLNWDTAHGTVGVAHSLRSVSTAPRDLAQAVYEQYWDYMHEVYAALVIPSAPANLDGAPELGAIDLLPDCHLSDSYEVTWRQLAGVLGAHPPWFHWALRDKLTISAWKPGNSPAIVPAADVELPTQALAELAVDEPDGSPAAAVCLWLARRLRRRAAESAGRDIDEIRAAAEDPANDCAYIEIAAVPAPVLSPEGPEPEETILRAGWAQIVERRDVLAVAAADAMLRWDGGDSWPVGAIARFAPDSCPAAAEWTARLQPAAAGQPPTVLERHLLEHVSSVDRGELLADERSGCPAVRRTDHLGKITVYAYVAQRINTLAPLAEVILRDSTVWIRTGDGGLWLAPELSAPGVSWGYSGSGPRTLALLLDQLLEDITSPAVSTYTVPPSGLESLLEATPQEGTTTYNRAQLLAARAG